MTVLCLCGRVHQGQWFGCSVFASAEECELFTDCSAIVLCRVVDSGGVGVGGLSGRRDTLFPLSAN